MLRTKQLGTLSQCARTFYLANSRTSSADGASCTCSEDETCVSNRPSGRNNSLRFKKKAGLVSEVETKTGSGLKDAVKTVSQPPSESCDYKAPVTRALSPKSSVRSDKLSLKVGVTSSNNVGAASHVLGHPTKQVDGHFIQGNIKKGGVLSDFANNRLLVTEGNRCIATPVGVVESVQPSNSKSSNWKSYQRSDYKVQSHNSVNAEGRSNIYCNSQNYSTDGKTKRFSACKALQNGSSSISDASAETKMSQLSTQERRKCIPQRERSHPSSSIPDKLAGSVPRENTELPTFESDIYAHRPRQPMRYVKKSSVTPAMPSLSNYGPVDMFHHTLKQLKWGPVAEKALGNIRYKLDPFQANQVLKMIQDPSIALGFFNWLKHQPDFRHDGHTYTTMVGILGRARQFSSARGLLEEMVKNGCHPNVVTYNRLIHGYGRANYIEDAMKLFFRMQEVGCKPDRVTFSTLIDIHAKAGYLDDAMGLYQQMLEAGLSPDTFTYSVIINCLGKAGHLPAAYKLFCEMVEQGCVPNLVTYNIMIALQAKARNYPCALKIYQSMRGAGFRPDKITYSIVMEVLGHCGHLDEVEAVFMEMKQDWFPDEPAYGLLVDLWGKAGKVDKARYWYQSMLDAGLCPNVPTCNSLLSAFLRVNRFSDAYDVLQNMLELGLHPSLQTCTLLLSYCTHTKSHMGFCCGLMAATGHAAHIFLLSLPAAEPGGMNVRNHASAFLDFIHSEDRESKRGLMDAVTNFLHKSGLKEEAGAVWEVAAERNVYPDVVREKTSGHWLINLHVMSEGTAITALSRTFAWFRREMLVSGIGPDRIDVITGWGRRSRVTGSSLVRQAIRDLLHLFRSPFNTENGNSGCFVGCGEPLHTWLLHSYVERMHLL